MFKTQTLKNVFRCCQMLLVMTSVLGIYGYDFDIVNQTGKDLTLESLYETTITSCTKQGVSAEKSHQFLSNSLRNNSFKNLQVKYSEVLASEAPYSARIITWLLKTVTIKSPAYAIDLQKVDSLYQCTRPAVFLKADGAYRIEAGYRCPALPQ